MRVSLNTIKQYIDFDLPPVDELVERINARLGGVEEVIDLGTKYKDAVIVRVVECEKHPDADKLSLCQIDVGAGELVQVVCGAPNVEQGMWAVWLPPKSIVPSSFDDEEPFVLGARELRGKMSNGMLASARELALGDDHDGIVEITERDIHAGKQLAPGEKFVEVFGLDDTIIDIENKMFTHRPDLFGQLGVAREIAGIYHHQFASPDWYTKMQDLPSVKDSILKLEVFNEAPDVVPRFMAVAIKGIEVKPSPLWLRIELVRLGGKPINNIVDATNYIMLLTAQPTHAYDYDKLRGHKLGARMARKGETAKLLNGKTYQLDEADIVIADGEGVVGLAGIMGGGESEVSSDTTNIVLEVASFDMYAVRKSAMRHGVFTDALTRFNKGQSPLQNGVVTAHLMNMITRLAGGEQASEVYDLKNKEWGMKDDVKVTADFINQRLGLQLAGEEISTLLTNVEIPSTADSSSLTVPSPFWRTDLELPEDIVEEVGRLYGFDKLPRELPQRSIRPAPQSQLQATKQSVRDSLSRAGANEVLTYSFVHENTLKRAGQDIAQAFRLSNALSPDLQYYRLSVLPSLLEKVHANIKAGHDEFALYEIGKAHNKKYHADDDEGLPGEMQFVDAVYTSKNVKQGAAFYAVRRLLDQLALDHGLSLVYAPADATMDYPVAAPFDLARSAMVHTTDGTFVGMIGELRQAVVRDYKLPQYTAALTLDTQSLTQAIASTPRSYQPLSRYPSVWQDVSLRVASDEAYASLTQTVTDAAQAAAGDTVIKIVPTTIYQPEDDSSVKTITYRITATNYERTLTDDDVRAIIEQVEAAVETR